jgi:hypothetical protein
MLYKHFWGSHTKKGLMYLHFYRHGNQKEGTKDNLENFDLSGHPTTQKFVSKKKLHKIYKLQRKTSCKLPLLSMCMAPR